MNDSPSAETARPQESAPLVSICIPSYNYGRFITHAVDSALAQTHPCIEVVVRDNASTDDTREVLERYRDDPRVRVGFNERNIGLSPNFNRVAAEARGAYLVWLCADDMLLPTHVDHLLRRLHDRDDPVDLVYGRTLYMDESGRAEFFHDVPGELDVAYSGRDELPEFLISGFLCLPTMLISRALIERFGLFDERFTVSSDWDLALRMLKGGIRTAHLREPVALIRRHAAQASSAAGYLETPTAFDERLTLLESTVNADHHARIHGYERAIAGRLGNLVASHRSAEAPDAGLIARAETLIERLQAFAVENPAPPADRPRVSVLMPSAGEPARVEQAIHSLEAQRFEDWELVLVQNGNPTLAPWLRTFDCARRIRHVYYSERQNVARMRNIASRLAVGDLIAYLDDDNRMPPEFLAEMVAEIDRGGCDAVIGTADLIVCESTMAGVTAQRVSGTFRREADPVRAAVYNDVPLNAVVHRKRVFDLAGRFTEGLPLLEDHDFLLRLQRSALVRHRPDLVIDLFQSESSSAHLLWREAAANVLPAIDWLYTVHPAGDPRAAELRAQHRGLVESQLARILALPDLERITSGWSLLAGNYQVTSGGQGRRTDDRPAPDPAEGLLVP